MFAWENLFAEGWLWSSWMQNIYLICGLILVIFTTWKVRGWKFRDREEQFRQGALQRAIFDAEAAHQLLLDATQFNRYKNECTLLVELIPLNQSDVVRQVRCTATVLSSRGEMMRDVVIELNFNGWRNSVVERSVLTEFEMIEHRRFDFERIRTLRNFIYDVPHYDRRHIDKELQRVWEAQAAPQATPVAA